MVLIGGSNIADERAEALARRGSGSGTPLVWRWRTESYPLNDCGGCECYSLYKFPLAVGWSSQNRSIDLPDILVPFHQRKVDESGLVDRCLP